MQTSKLGEKPSSVPLALLMETQHKLEIAARIRELRSRSPFTQANLADKLGITLRAYQRLEEVGTTKWERCEELGTIYDVTPEFIWDGSEKAETPDVLRTLNGSSSAQLDRIEADLTRLLEWAGLEGRSQEVASRLSEEADDVLPKADERGQRELGERESGRGGP